MEWFSLAIWAASVAIGWYVGSRTGDVDVTAAGIGWSFILGPVGLVGWLLVAKPTRRHTEPAVPQQQEAAHGLRP
jgi:hypothetical protein